MTCDHDWLLWVDRTKGAKLTWRYNTLYFNIPVTCEEGYKLLPESQGVEPVLACSFLKQLQHVHCEVLKSEL